MLSLVCLTTPLTIIRRALNATFRTTDREESLSSWAAPFVIAENEVSCSLRHPLVLQDSCIFRRSRIQRQPSPVVAQVARSSSPSRSSQRSRANSEHRSLHGGDVPKRERPPSNSNLQKRQPVTFDEDVPPVPSRARTRALTTASSSRNTGTPPSAGECYRRWSA